MSKATDQSWPNWNVLLQRSRILRELWREQDRLPFELFQQLLGRQHFSKNISDYRGRNVRLFLRLLTLKLWLEQRIMKFSNSPADDARGHNANSARYGS